MFRGTSPLVLDGKGRMSVPSKHRERLTAQGEARLLMLTLDPTQGCLLLYPMADWEVVERRINAMSSMDPVGRQLKTVVVGSAEEVEMDSAGRILINPVLRRFAKLEKDAVLTGQGNKLAIWSAESWQAQVDAAARLPELINAAMRDGTLPEEIKGFSL
ncbi:MAG: division/cell wall cluster transcriptional repressor MraZ [Betaproteobacteria bacterium]|nr:division/cell wall cluster transcriptional repressor MraZ [Betaproteobacteria bacterium]